MNWQQKTRLLIAVAAVAFAIVVAFAFKPRPPAPVSTPVNRTDPKALLETASGRTFRFNRAHEDVRIEYDKLLGYPDGTTKLFGVKIITERGHGRTYTIAGKEASGTIWLPKWIGRSSSTASVRIGMVTLWSR